MTEEDPAPPVGNFIGKVASVGMQAQIEPEIYEAALFEGGQQVTDWVLGPPCEFGKVAPGPDAYRVRIPDGRVYAGLLPVRPTGGTFVMVGRFHWGTAFPGRYDLYRIH